MFEEIIRRADKEAADKTKSIQKELTNLGFDQLENENKLDAVTKKIAEAKGKNTEHLKSEQEALLKKKIEFAEKEALLNKQELAEKVKHMLN